MPEWYCHQCNKKIVPISQHTEPTCPFCMQTFVEQMEQDDDHIDTVADDDMYGTFSNTSSTPTTPNPATSPFFQMPRQQQQQPHMQQLDLNAMLQQLFGMPPQQQQAQNQQQQQQRQPRNFLEMFDSIMNANNNGAMGQQQHPFGFTFGGPQGSLRIGDYVLGDNLDAIISQLADQFNGPVGTPPAAKSELEKLKKVQITSDDVAKKLDCAVCQDMYKQDEQVTKMPCSHVFHEECLMPWLKLHNQCPICRYELKTDDKEYENRKKQKQQGTTTSAPSTPTSSTPTTQPQQPSQQQQQQQQAQQQQFNPFSFLFGTRPQGGNNNNNNNNQGGGGPPSYFA